VSHLGVQISALVDGELTGAELDRAHAHLATCELCRSEAAELRQLKRELRALAAPLDAASDEADRLAWARDDEALTRRLLAMAGPGGPVPSRRLREQHRGMRSRDGLPRAGRAARGSLNVPRRGRYMLWSAVSLAVVGIGAAAFSMGGPRAEPGPKVTPQLEMFSVEHAVTSGDVPFPDPTLVPSGTTRP
jgi:anti-sigma factor RsiW